MSNLEQLPVEHECAGSPTSGVEVLSAREVPLGGPRAMLVRRTLPQRQRSLIGAWCFVDHYGPEDVTRTAGMDVAPHPHTGLQTVSWLFSGEIEHRDSAGVHAMVRPGELNLMTAGAGISHSEVSTPDTTILHGAQLWVVLPESARDTRRDFTHHIPAPVALDGAQVRVFLGEVAGELSPVPTFTPLLGAEIVLDPYASVALEVRPDFEHGVLSDRGDLRIADTDLLNGDLGYMGLGTTSVTIANTGPRSARCLLLGGQPFTEELIMWWNFVGRAHDEIASYREQWETGAERFGSVAGYVGSHDRIPAPTLPTTVLRPRVNPAPRAGITDNGQDLR